jgi:folate-binding protein YgfZ
MPALQYSLLPWRGVLSVSGAEARSFLQGLVSNDVSSASINRAVWAALLTPQGKYLHDFFISSPAASEQAASEAETLWLEAEAERLPDLFKRLKLYRLRSKVTLTDRREDLAVAVAWGEGIAPALGLPDGEAGAARPVADHAGAEGVAFLDPRLAAAGARVIAPEASLRAVLQEAGAEEAAPDEWDGLRIAHGLPDGSRDMVVDKAILLENGFDELGGCDWKKGCFVGQELTARTKYRGLIKKRLLPVRLQGEGGAPGTEITLDGKAAGELRSQAGDQALALMRLEALRAAEAGQTPLLAGSVPVVPEIPSWMRLPAAE